jgi:hypothetical protein
MPPRRADRQQVDRLRRAAEQMRAQPALERWLVTPERTGDEEVAADPAKLALPRRAVREQHETAAAHQEVPLRRVAR